MHFNICIEIYQWKIIIAIETIYPIDEQLYRTHYILVL